LLQLKELGRNPTLLNLDVDPNIEMFPFLAQRISLEISPSLGGAMATAGLVNGNTGFRNVLVGGVNVQVPNNETWYVDETTLFVANIPAADTIVGVSVGYTVPGGGLYTISPPVSDVITARARALISSFPRPLFIPPSANLGVFVSDILTATTITITLFMRAARLLI